VAVLRDGPGGLEILMMLRPVEAEFVPRAQVFPGGRIDEADADPVWARLCNLDAEEAAVIAEDGEEQDKPSALTFRVGGIREVFEETAVLLGVEGDLFPDRWWAEAARTRVHSSGEAFAEVIEAAGLRLRPGALAYFARWVTPESLPKRYDTRFYAAAMPAGQEAVAAPGEVESVEWITPALALERADTNAAYTLPPTRAALGALAQYHDAASALEGLAQGRDLTPILPRIVLGGQPGPDIRVVMPGEPGYDEEDQ
jgi:8-oxo-dGTP pyrophosphatase MutT (NUDIX family)